MWGEYPRRGFGIVCINKLFQLRCYLLLVVRLFSWTRFRTIVSLWCISYHHSCWLLNTFRVKNVWNPVCENTSMNHRLGNECRLFFSFFLFSFSIYSFFPFVFHFHSFYTWKWQILNITPWPLTARIGVTHWLLIPNNLFLTLFFIGFPDYPIRFIFLILPSFRQRPTLHQPLYNTL